MKNIALIITVFLVITSVISAEKAPSLNGTWCVGEEGFILRFSGKDSLHVTSSTDESIQAEGSYNKNDTSFTATVKNGDVTMKMKYLYRWCSKDSIKAKAEQFTINDEPVNSPEEWMFMVRCKESAK
ncbi:MAG: hypothetical protein GX267_15340 [Fibrobacter sp.]|jgi:hypothetical protein|nr:hypothetical protein [Fibrobacter sp.]